MRVGDRQLGTPFTEYRDTKVNIESLSGMVGGEVAHATDTGENGYYDEVGAAWVWGGGGGGSLDDLSDVILTGVAQNDFLVRGATEWNNLTPILARTAIGLVAGGAGDIWVEKAGDTMTGALVIDGSSDQTVLKLQAHSTMSAASYIMDLQNSSATSIFRVTRYGAAYITGYGTNNVFISGGNETTTYASCVAIGVGALYSISNPSAGSGVCFALGYDALRNLTTGVQNIGIGYSAAKSVTTGSNNLAIGTSAMQNVSTSSSGNVAIGDLASYSKGGTGNTAVGKSAMESGGAGNNNVAIGYYAGYSLAANENTIIGSQAGFSLSSGVGNVFIGFLSGANQTTLSNLLIVDNRARASIAEEQTNSIIYGVMAATVAAQSLRVNAVLQTFGRKRSVVTKTANYTATVTDEVIRFTTSAALTLPAATGSGQSYAVIADGCTVTIDGNGSETINNELTQTLYDGDAAILHDVASGKWNIG